VVVVDEVVVVVLTVVLDESDVVVSDWLESSSLLHAPSPSVSMSASVSRRVFMVPPRLPRPSTLGLERLFANPQSQSNWTQ
jgi:hypothetical protein